MDVSKDAQFGAFVRFVDQNETQGEFLFCKQLPECTASSEIVQLKVINAVYNEIDIPKANCVALCNDVGKAMD